MMNNLNQTNQFSFIGKQLGVMSSGCTTEEGDGTITLV
jgi:hypothetical protein